MTQGERRILPELEERVEQIFSAIEELREIGDEGRARRKILDAIFRDVHSLKAAAFTSGLDQLAHVCHEFENLLHSVRVGRTNLDYTVITSFDEAAEALFSSLSSKGPVGTPAPSVFTAATVSDKTQRREAAEVEIVLKTLPPDVWKALGDHEKHRLQESVGEGANVYLVTTNFEMSNFDDQFQALKELLGFKGEVISTAPRVNAQQPDRIDFRIVYTREAELEEIRKELRPLKNVFISELVETAGLSGPPANATQADTAIGGPTSSLPPSKTINIRLEDLDRIISFTHRLSRETSRELGSASEEKASEDSHRTDARKAIDEAFLKLAAQLIDLRMVPIERVLQRGLRSGRRLAQASGKEIDFHVRGSELLLDKSLCDAIADPVIHLVRNAVDHGIEPILEREKKGKQRRGSVRIEAESAQGQTRIRVSDDGRGINPIVVSAAADRLGLLCDGTTLSMEQCVRIVFRSGFSTATEVSNTSGRGVGLDVVETAVEDIGGEIRVSSLDGLGSVFEIRLPITFGLIESLIVSVGDQYYLLDQKRVVEYHETYDIPARLGEEVWPVHHLSKVLGKMTNTDATRQGGLVVCELKNELPDGSSYTDRVALLVDSIIGQQKVLVRSLGSKGSRWFGVAGAAELRNGRIALLLDLARLIKAQLEEN